MKIRSQEPIQNSYLWRLFLRVCSKYRFGEVFAAFFNSFSRFSYFFSSFFSRKFITCFLVFVISSANFLAIFPSESMAYSGYQGARPAGSNCSERTGSEPCYSTTYDENSHTCNVGGFDFNPYVNPSIDYNPDYSNKACIGYLVGAGTVLAASVLYGTNMCPKASILGRVVLGASAASVGTALAIFLSPEISFIASDATFECAFLAGVAYVSPDPVSKQLAIQCCKGAAMVGVAVVTSITALASIYGIAKRAFDENSICGSGWYEWHKNSVSKIYEKRKGIYGRCLDYVFSSIISDNDNQDLSAFKSKCNSLGITKSLSKSESEPKYREYLYGGFEYSDNSPSACKNPGSLMEKLGYRDEYQKYYMTGAGEAPNYACHRFALNGLRDQNEINAYECCKRVARNKICIKSGKTNFSQILGTVGSGFYLGDAGAALGNQIDQAATRDISIGGMNSVQSGAAIGAAAGAAGGPATMAVGAAVGASTAAIVSSSMVQSTFRDVTFCDIGSNCFVNAVEYQTYTASANNSNYFCARTVSVCPYDHLLGGGTEQKMLNSKNSVIKNRNVVANFCQYMRHCSKAPIMSDAYIPDFSGFFISSACKDMVGDSQLSYSYAGNLLPVNNRSFSAPMVQCFKETIENSFLGLAGYSVCSDPDEKPDPKTGLCASGNMLTKGEAYGESFFVKIQKNLRFLIKFILIFAMMMFGVAIFLALPDQYLGKKAVIGFILKFGLVAYFALGDAWIKTFYRDLINVPASMMNLTFHPRVEEDNYVKEKGDRDDGCNYPRYNYNLKSEPNSNQEKFVNPSYPPGKAYLRPWDTLDCKLSRALGYGPEVSVPNIAIMIITGVFFGAYGIIFFLAGFAFFFLMLYIIIRSIHIFLLSITSITLMIYVSPIVIVMAMFEKTKSTFENWWKQIFGFIFQPMVLFAYLGILMTVIDTVFIGSARFEPGGNLTGNNPDTRGYQFPKKINCSSYYVSDSNNKYAKEGTEKPGPDLTLKDPRNDSIYCMFSLQSFEKYNGFEIFGVALPILGSMNKEKVNTIFKLAVLMFVFVTFLEKITLFAAKLVGGVELKSDWQPNVHGQAAAMMSGIQTRALRGMKKFGSGIGSGIASLARKNATPPADNNRSSKPTEGANFSANSNNLGDGFAGNALGAGSNSGDSENGSNARAGTSRSEARAGAAKDDT